MFNTTTFAQPVQGNSTNTADFYQMSLEFDRLWRAALKGPKQEVAGMIMDRTVRYGKLWERVSLTQMTDGIWSRAGKLVHAGLSLCRRAIQNALDELVELGVVLRRDTANNGYEYAINWEFDIMGMLPESKRERAKRASGVSLPLPKERCSGARDAIQAVHEMPHSGARDATLTKDNNIDTNQGSEAAAPQSGGEPSSGKGLSAVIAGVSVAARNRVESRRLRVADSITTRTLQRDWWAALCRDNFPGMIVPPFNPKQRGQAKNLIRELGKETGPLLEWVLANWHLVRKAQFPEARGVKFPDTPDFSFFFSFRHSFFKVYNDRVTAEALAVNPKAALVQHFRKQGLTYEQAVEAAGAETQLSARERALDEREANLVRGERVLAEHVNSGRRSREVTPVTAKEFVTRQRERTAPRDNPVRASEIKKWD